MRLSALSRPMTLNELQSVGFWVPNGAAVFIDSESQTAAEYKSCLGAEAYLERYICERKFSEKDLRVMESAVPDIYNFVVDCARVAGLKDTLSRALANATIGSEGNQAPILLHAYQDELEFYKARMWLTDRQA